ncbi:MAG: hypothetical protein HY856_09625 [Burkholderiales bacterium]|nr:hypothetical protein [Burkholderiales bacterium]
MMFNYDAAGNRTKVVSHVLVAGVGDPDVETLKDSTRYFVYDSMNRQTIVDGVLDAGGNVVIGQTQGHQLTYDVNGNRTSDKFWGRKVTSSQTTYTYYDEMSGEVTYTGPMVYTASYGYTMETYQYDAMDRLSLVDRDGTVVDQRWYDGAGRVVQSGPVNLPTA